jgi:hypothetical protein
MIQKKLRLHVVKPVGARPTIIALIPCQNERNHKWSPYKNVSSSESEQKAGGTLQGVG